MSSNILEYLEEARIYNEDKIEAISKELNISKDKALEIIKASKMEPGKFYTCLMNGCIKDKVMEVLKDDYC